MALNNHIHIETRIDFLFYCTIPAINSFCQYKLTFPIELFILNASSLNILRYYIYYIAVGIVIEIGLSQKEKDKYIFQNIINRYITKYNQTRVIISYIKRYCRRICQQRFSLDFCHRVYVLYRSIDPKVNIFIVKIEAAKQFMQQFIQPKDLRQNTYTISLSLRFIIFRSF